jgi:excisionase family DNA binding protein
MNPPARRWISVSEAAAYLGLHPHGVRKMIYRGTIPAVHVGRSVRVDLKRLEAQLEAQLEELGQR